MFLFVLLDYDAHVVKQLPFLSGRLHQADGMPPMPQLMRYKSIAGSHTNLSLRAFLHGAKCGDLSAHDHLCVAGSWNLEKLKAVDPQYFAACHTGLTWLVIDQRVEKEFPSFAKLAQSAANVSVARAESELQVLRKIHAAVMEVMKAKQQTSCTWDDIKAAVLRSKPVCAPYAPYLFQFVLKTAGGKASSLLNETESIVNSSGFPARSLGSELFIALCSEVKGADQHAMVRHMLLRLAYSTAEKSLTASDVKRVLAPGMQQKRSMAETLYQQCKTVARNQVDPGVQEAKKQVLLGKLSMDLASYLVGKRKRDGQEHFDSLEACAGAFVDEMQKLYETVIAVPFIVPPAGPNSGGNASAKKKPTSKNHGLAILSCKHPAFNFHF